MQLPPISSQRGLPVHAGHRSWRWSGFRQPSLAVRPSSARPHALGWATTEAQGCLIPDVHCAHLVHASCHTAEPWPRAVHSRTPSRVGVYWLRYANTWCQVSATRQSLGHRAFHSRAASRLGVSWLGWCTHGVSLLPHGRARAPEPSIAARRHGWRYPGWVGAYLVFCRRPTAEPGPQSRP